MPSGYEKSPDYGGPEPEFGFSLPVCIIVVLLMLILLAGVAR
ncbi:MAG: hypothetical protein AB7U62_03100 [Pseudolabrys sp.]